MIEPAIRTILAGNAAVTAVVADRIWHGNRPQDERRPGIVLSLISATHPQTLDDHGGYSTGTVQADVLAPSYREAKELAAKVRAALDQYSGTVAGADIDWLIIEDESDIPTVPLEGKAVPTAGVSLEVSFMVRR